MFCNHHFLWSVESSTPIAMTLFGICAPGGRREVFATEVFATAVFATEVFATEVFATEVFTLLEYECKETCNTDCCKHP